MNEEEIVAYKNIPCIVLERWESSYSFRNEPLIIRCATVLCGLEEESICFIYGNWVDISEYVSNLLNSK